MCLILAFAALQWLNAPRSRIALSIALAELYLRRHAVDAALPPATNAFCYMRSRHF